jgi:hypothetical protein
MVYSIGIQHGATALDTVDDVPFFDEQFSQVGTILSGDTGD